jgi:plasmid maintenance system antidote protein VapI
MNWELKKRILDLYRSQADFAEAAKVHDSVISRVVRGRRKLSREEKKRWAFLLRCKPEQIFHGFGGKK